MANIIYPASTMLYMSIVLTRATSNEIHVFSDSLCLVGSVRREEQKIFEVSDRVALAITGAFREERIVFFKTFAKNQNKNRGIHLITKKLTDQIEKDVRPTITDKEDLGFILVGFHKAEPTCVLVKVRPNTPIEKVQYSLDGQSYVQGIPEATEHIESLLSRESNLMKVMEDTIALFPDKLGLPVQHVTLIKS